MLKKERYDVKSPVLFSAKCQLSVIVTVAFVLWFGDEAIAKSYALGGIVYAIPNLYFVHYAFRYSGTGNVPLIARSLAWGESGKFALAAFGFVVVYRVVDPLHSGGLFAGFASMILIQWFVAARIVRMQQLAEANSEKV